MEFGFSRPPESDQKVLNCIIRRSEEDSGGLEPRNGQIALKRHFFFVLKLYLGQRKSVQQETTKGTKCVHSGRHRSKWVLKKEPRTLDLQPFLFLPVLVNTLAPRQLITVFQESSGSGVEVIP